MSTKSKIAAGAALAAMLSLGAGAAMADAKIAVIRGPELMRASSLEKDANAKLANEFNKRRSDLEAQQQKFQDDVGKYQRDHDTMSPDQQAKTEKDLNSRKIDIGHAGQQLQQDLDSRKMQLSMEIQSRVQTAVQQIAKERGYDLVLDNAVYSSPAFDITDEVVKRLNQPAAPASTSGK